MAAIWQRYFFEGTTVQMTTEAATFELPATMKIDDCHALHTFLAAAQDRPVVINCDQVVRLGGLAAQLLFFGLRLWTSKGVSYSLSDPSEGFTQCLSDLGMSEHLSMQGTIE